MINYRRFGRRRLLSIPLSELHIAAFPVQVKTFHALKASGRPITSIRVDPKNRAGTLDGPRESCEINVNDRFLTGNKYNSVAVKPFTRKSKQSFEQNKKTKPGKYP